MTLAELNTPPSRIGPGCNGMLLTPEEYDSLRGWDPGYRYELVHGVLVVAPPPAIGERSPNDELGFLIRLYKESHPNGGVVDETVPEQEVRCGRHRRRADRAIWVGLGRGVRPLDDVPAIVVEFVSDSSRDRRRDLIEKRREYATAGVREYWVIDRFERQMYVFRGEQEASEVTEGETYQTPLLPGFELPLARLLAKADVYRTDEE